MPGQDDGDIDLQGPVMKIPSELTYHIASLLPIKALFMAAMVCRRWRTLLLGCPELWTCIRIAFGGSRDEKKRPGRTDLWEPLLDAYLTRSQGLPLAVHLSIGDDFGDPACPELVGVTALLCSNMHRTRSLSVTLRPFYGTMSPVPAYLSTRAPILRSFCLDAREGFIEILRLFSDHAPCLASVEIAGDAYFAGKPLLSFPSITQLCYGGVLLTELAQDLLAQVPALQRLTLNMPEPVAFDPPFPGVIDLQIRVQQEWDASVYFPHARSICYALGSPHGAGVNDWDVSKANLAVTLTRLKHRTIKSLDMRLSRLCVRPLAGTDFDVIRMVVQADGAYIAVDLDWIRQTAYIVSSLHLHALERLVLHEGIWEDFMDLELPHLTELTVHLRGALEWWPLKRPSAARQPWPVSVLRFAHSPAVDEKSANAAEVALSIKAADVATLITRNLDPLALTRVVLRGWELAEPGMGELRITAPQARILYEDEITCDDWVKPTGWPTRYMESKGLQV
ncbi:hypothetical protein AURDEDRAFT_176703 [Auricularia subglabra TFB-10046 SS5]|uniref:F-box domain-containing protein n=1 Tax=Auricularia subglabra (strain TFB-10046 / SS5) TaxID=717982 RepID=J0CV24_AURST|nr:hypothetical protein AURDEDRAFT_176703 [Auricularia subglabra TFB-10046 SS5]